MGCAGVGEGVGEGDTHTRTNGHNCLTGYAILNRLQRCFLVRLSHYLPVVITYHLSNCTVLFYLPPKPFQNGHTFMVLEEFPINFLH